jgi:hypothetical protein
MKRLTTDAGLIDYFWSLVDKNGPLPERSTRVNPAVGSGWDPLGRAAMAGSNSSVAYIHRIDSPGRMGAILDH